MTDEVGGAQRQGETMDRFRAWWRETNPFDALGWILAVLYSVLVGLLTFLAGI